MSSFLIKNIFYYYSLYIENKSLIENSSHVNNISIILIIMLLINVCYKFLIKYKNEYSLTLFSYNFLYLMILCLYIKYILKIENPITQEYLSIKILIYSFLIQILVLFFFYLIKKKQKKYNIKLNSFYGRIFIIVIIILYSSFNMNCNLPLVKNT